MPSKEGPHHLYAFSFSFSFGYLASRPLACRVRAHYAGWHYTVLVLWERNGIFCPPCWLQYMRIKENIVGFKQVSVLTFSFLFFSLSNIWICNHSTLINQIRCKCRQNLKKKYCADIPKKHKDTNCGGKKSRYLSRLGSSNYLWRDFCFV